MDPKPKSLPQRVATALRELATNLSPVEVATSILFGGIAGTLLADVAIRGINEPGPLQVALALLLLLVSLGALVCAVTAISFGGFLAGSWLRTDPKGGLTFLAAVGLVLILVQLWAIEGGREAFLQTTAGVVSAAFIALAIQHPRQRDSDPSMSPEE